MPDVFIRDIAAFLPNRPVGNHEMEALLGQVGQRPSRARRIILRSNGIINRYYAIDPQTGRSTHTNAMLAAEAIRILAQRGCPLDKIELLACGTSLPDQLMPNHAVMVQGELAMPPCEVASLAGICIAGVMALKYAFLSVRAGESSNAIATGSENASALLRGHNFPDPAKPEQADDAHGAELAFSKDFLRWMLSDGAGAMWLADTPNTDGISLRLDWIWQSSYAGEMETCMYAGAVKNSDGSLTGWRDIPPRQWLPEAVFAIKQDVKLLNEQVINYTVTRPLRRLAATGRLDPERIDWFLPHYSSEFFRDRVAQGMEKAGVPIPQHKWFTNLAQKGNTGSASMYIILEELFHSGRLKSGETIFCYIPESGRFSAAFIHLTVI